MSELLAKYS